MIKKKPPNKFDDFNKIIIIIFYNPLLPSSLPMKYPITNPIRNIPLIRINLNISPDEIIISIPTHPISLKYHKYYFYNNIYQMRF